MERQRRREEHERESIADAVKKKDPLFDLSGMEGEVTDGVVITWRIILVSKRLGSPPFRSHLDHLEGEQLKFQCGFPRR